VLPWKYGFKSVKSIAKIEFLEDRPVNFWQDANSREYGFWVALSPLFFFFLVVLLLFPSKRTGRFDSTPLLFSGERQSTSLTPEVVAGQ